MEASRRQFIQGGVSAIIGLAALKSGLALLPADAAVAEPHFSREEMKALEERLRRLMWGFDVTPYNTGQYAELFRDYKSTLAVEHKSQINYLDLAELKKRTHFVATDGKEARGFVWTVEHIQAGLGFAATPVASDEVLLSQIKAMCCSFQVYREVQAANVLNYGLSYDAAVGGDGVPLFSTQHPTEDGMWANTFAEYRPLTPDNLKEAAQAIHNFVDDRNLKIMLSPRKLVVPVTQMVTVERMIQAGTFPVELLPDGYVVNDYLEDLDSWYIKTNADGLCHFRRIPLEFDAWLGHWDRDPTTDLPIEYPPQHVLGKGYERCSFACNDPRAIFGVMKKAIERPKRPKRPDQELSTWDLDEDWA